MYLIEGMKGFGIGVVLLSALAMAAAGHKDTETIGKWVRASGPLPSRSPELGVIPSCEAAITTHDDALRLLAGRPDCTGKAIAALKWIAKSVPAVWTDVAAAYCVRARREKRSADYLDALQAANHAIVATPQLPATRFNRALALENLGLTDEAITAWDDFLSVGQSSQAAAGRLHRERLVRMRDADAARAWGRTRGALQAAMQAHDRAAIARLITPFPSTAERYLLDDLPLEWSAPPRPEQFLQMRLLAEELTRITRDRFDLDVVDALARSPRKLWRGHRAYANARHKLPNIRPTSFQNAADLLDGSPLQLLALVFMVPGNSWKKPAQDVAFLDKLMNRAERLSYAGVQARIASMSGYCKHFSSRDFDALLSYDAAVTYYGRVRDDEGVFASHVRKIGIYNTIGQKDLAWAEVAAALPLQSRVVETRSRHAFLGETANAAFALDHPLVALRYQDLAVQLATGDADTAQLPSALSRRAKMELEVGYFNQARRDLEKAKELSAAAKDDRIRQSLDVHILEVDGHAWLADDPARAIGAFTKALDDARRSQAKTDIARLLAARAEAKVKTHEIQSAEDDLRDALETLREEEKGNLDQRRPGVGEEVWSSYFSRFQGAYRLLIRQLMEDKRPEEAFVYAEKARAYDLLNLVQRADLDALELPQLQALIPPDTTIIEYCVLEDRTYVWIVTRESCRPFELSVTGEEIAGWSSTLQTAAHHYDLRTFEATIRAAYEQLIAPFLLSIQKPTRLVFVPDGAIYGLPIAALQDTNSRRYVLQEGVVSIAASAKMYLYSLQRDETMPRDEEPSELLVGDPAFDPAFKETMKLPRLPLARREVLRIRQIYGANATVLTDINATVAEFLTLAPLKTIVHVAAHGIPNAADPSHSFLLLARSGANSGALDAEQLWQKLSLTHTRLMVLSACSSAGGLPVGPEGVTPLVRPLIGKGVPAVVGSLWEVDDATAEPLLVSFHRQYRLGNDAAEALRTAQLEMLKKNNPGLRSVLAWGPFQVIGYASSPFAPSRRQ